MSLWLTESPPSPITFVMTIGSVCKSQSMHNDFFIGWPIHSCIEDGLLLKSCSPSASSVFGENPWEICLGCCSNGGWGSHPCSKALLFFFFSFSLGPHFTIVCVHHHHHHHHHRDNCFDLSHALFDISISISVSIVDISTLLKNINIDMVIFENIDIDRNPSGQPDRFSQVFLTFPELQGVFLLLPHQKVKVWKT